MQRLLADAYLDPKNPASFSSMNNLVRSVKNAKLKDVKKYLKGVPTYTLHKPVRHRFPRKRTLGSGPFFTLQADLCDYAAYKSQNDQTTFLLTVIDVYTRMLYVKPLKSKSGIVVCKALAEIFEENDFVPIYVFTDEGKEFYNSHVQAMFKENSIRHYSPNSQMKCAMVERVNRTLKGRLEKYMYHKNSRRYIDVLPDIVNGINHSVNRSIKMRPVDVTANILEERPAGPDKQCKLSVGEMVRITTARATFQKGYEKGWSEEEFYIFKCFPGSPPTYRLKDVKGEVISGIFYDHELTPCSNPDKIYKVEKILDRRTRKGVKEVLIRWLGYDSSFDSWEKEREVILL